MTQKDLAENCGLSTPAIAKIISGERIGKPETWDKIYSVFDKEINVSYASKDFINELKEEIELYSGSKSCLLFYKEDYGNLIFVDYALDEDMKDDNFTKEDLNKYNSLRTNLSDALELFKYQDKAI